MTAGKFGPRSQHVAVFLGRRFKNPWSPSPLAHSIVRAGSSPYTSLTLSILGAATKLGLSTLLYPDHLIKAQVLRVQTLGLLTATVLKNHIINLTYCRVKIDY